MRRRFAATRVQTEDAKRRLSEVAKANNLGGPTEGSGRGKSGWFRGYWCDSSYELAYTIYNLENGISFARNKERFPYVFKGVDCIWIPDYILPDGTYVEIKGYLDERSRAKHEQFNRPLTVLRQSDLKHVFDYVVAKYGRNFVELYSEAGAQGANET